MLNIFFNTFLSTQKVNSVSLDVDLILGILLFFNSRPEHSTQLLD